MGLTLPFLLSCFISGLNPELRREVQALYPLSLPQAAALAKLQEDKIPGAIPLPSFDEPTIGTSCDFQS